MMKRIVLCTLLLLFTIIGKAQTALDEKLVQEVVLKYVEAFKYDSLERNERKVSDLLQYHYSKDVHSVEGKLYFKPLESLAQRMAERQRITRASPVKITVFEVRDLAAAAKAESKGGVHYFHLAKTHEEWVVRNVLWQE